MILENYIKKIDKNEFENSNKNYLYILHRFFKKENIKIVNNKNFIFSDFIIDVNEKILLEYLCFYLNSKETTLTEKTKLKYMQTLNYSYIKKIFIKEISLSFQLEKVQKINKIKDVYEKFKKNGERNKQLYFYTNKLLNFGRKENE